MGGLEERQRQQKLRVRHWAVLMQWSVHFPVLAGACEEPADFQFP